MADNVAEIPEGLDIRLITAAAEKIPSAPAPFPTVPR